MKSRRYRNKRESKMEISRHIMFFMQKKNIDETQSHLLFCEYLFGKNENVIYISTYDELYKGDLKEQIYVARLLQDNFKRRLPE